MRLIKSIITIVILLTFSISIYAQDPLGGRDLSTLKVDALSDIQITAILRGAQHIEHIVGGIPLKLRLEARTDIGIHPRIVAVYMIASRRYQVIETYFSAGTRWHRKLMNGNIISISYR